MNMKATAIIERATDGTYSIYVKEEFEDFALISSGRTPKEAIEDLNVAVQEIKEELGDRMPELEFEYKYDVASFLREFKDEFSMSGLEAITGINQKQLHHYLSGFRKPSEATTNKISKAIKDFAEKLAGIEFA